MRKESLFLLVMALVLFFTGTMLNADIDGSAGPSAYYQQELGDIKIGSSSVGVTGDSSYNYPMGMIQAAYNSESGWQVGTSSSIARSTKWGVPSYTADDVFTLNGSELGVKIDYYTGLDGYHTERENYCRIKYLYRATVDSWWEVTSKNGTLSKYGITADSKIEGIGRPATQPRVWAISETRDVYGNITMYKYSEDASGGGYYLSKIIKGKANAGTYGYTATLINYEAMPYPRISFREGAKVIINKRVKTVVEVIGCTINGDGGTIKKAYNIDWIETPLAKTSVISAIKEYGAGGIIAGALSLPATTFTYPAMNNSFGTKQPLGNIKANALMRLSGNTMLENMMDMDGDGLPDSISLDGNGYLWVQKQLNNMAGFALAENWGQPVYLREIQELYAGNFFTMNDLIDMDGDGRPDFVRMSTGWENEPLYVSRNNGHGFDPQVGWGNSVHTPIRYFRKNGQDRDLYYRNILQDLVDMNGDGLPDTVYHDNAGCLYVGINNGHGFEPGKNWTGAGLFNYLSSTVFVPSLSESYQELRDMNGDGLPDMLIRNKTTHEFGVFYNNGHGFEAYIPLAAPSLDFSWDATHSCGQGHNNLVVPTGIINCERGNTVRDIVDVNGDGLPDLVYSMVGADLLVALNNGMGFEHELVWANNFSGLGGVNGPGPEIRKMSGESFCYQQFMDMNNDGFMDAIFKNNTSDFNASQVEVAYYGQNSAPETMLTKVNNSSGGSIEYAYTPINKSSNPNYKARNWLVSTVTLKDGLGSFLTTSYDYFGGLYDSQYRENRGFREIVQTDPAGNKTERYYYQDNINSGLLQKEVVRDASGFIHSYIVNTYENYDLRPSNYGAGANVIRKDNGGPMMIVKAPQLVAVDTYLVGGTTAVDNGTQPGGADWKRLQKVISLYDNYGNLMTMEDFGEVNADGSDKGYDKKLTECYYAYNWFNWVMVPSSREVSGLEGKTGPYQHEIIESYYYDNGNTVDSYLDNGHVDSGILKGIIKRDGQWEARYGYDSYGNVNVIRDGNGNDTRIGYDSMSHTYPVAVTNAIGQIENYQYDNLMRITGKQDVNNVATAIEYDAFGRITKVVSPGDSFACPTVENVYEIDGIAPECIKTKYRITSGQSAALSNYSYQDGLGRTIQTKQPGATAGTWIISENWDFISGREHVQALRTPYLDASFAFNRSSTPVGELAITKSYLDSVFGSKQEKVNPSGISSSVFSKQFSTVYLNEKGNGGVETTDGLGNIIETKSYSDTYPFDTLYRVDEMYYRTGTGQLLKQVGDYDHYRMNYLQNYDAGGNLTFSVDPDKGITYYTYDANLNVLSDVVLYTYDSLNRMVSKNCGNGTTINYFYDEGGAAAYALGRLTRVVDASGTSEFRYDARGRLITEIKTITGGGSATTGYAYDAMDRLVSITYPDGEIVQQSYDVAGNLAKVGNPGQVDKYLKSISVNALGQITESVYGNGARNSYTYFGSGKDYQIQNAAIQKPDTAMMLNQNYDYDISGNIVSIDTGDSSCNQNFSYDFKNRLTGQNNPGYAGGASTFAYDTVDNLVQKNGACHYYATSRPHAVIGTSESPVVFQYDTAGNMVRKGLNLAEKDVTGFSLRVDNGQLNLIWQNPSDGSDIKGIRIVRKETGYPNDPYDGTLVWSGVYSPSFASFVDNGLMNGTTYYYKIYLLDQFGNYSAGAGASEKPSVVEYPWSENEYGTLSINQSWPSPAGGLFLPAAKMGYQFTPTVNGKITKLGAFCNGANSGGNKLVYLSDNDANGSVLAYAYVASLNSWAFAPITPVNVIANHTYSVYVTFDQEWNLIGSQRSGISLPQTIGDIRILKSFGSFADVNNKSKDTTTEMMGQVDVGFVPDSQTVQSAVAIRAKGTPYQGVWPIMEVYMNYNLVKQWNVNTADYKLYSVPVLNTSDANSIFIRFNNGSVAPSENRNLWIDYIDVSGKIIQAEDRGVSYVLLGGEKLAGRECMDASGILKFPLKGIGLKAEYYGNADFTSVLAVQTNENIDLDNWSMHLPPNLANMHSVRWSGQFEAKYNELYTLYTSSYGSVRVWVDGKKVIDNWIFHTTIENSCTLNLIAGKRYDIVVEYSTPQSIAIMCSLFWSTTSQPKEIVPQRQLFPERMIKSGGIDFLNPNLSAYWKFEQLPGMPANTLMDSSKNINNAVISSSPQWTTGIDGSALNFDGISSYACAGNNSSLNLTGNISIEAWVKTPGSAYNTFVIEKFNGDGYPYAGYGLAVAQNGSLMFWNGNPAEGWKYSSTPMKLVDNRWHHIAVTGNKSTGQGVFYVDGLPDGTFNYTGIPDNLNELMYIGSYKTGVQQVFNGIIDEVAVWNKALSAAEIQGRCKDSIKNSQMVASFNMDDSSITSIKDSSGNENNGNINGACFKQNKGVYVSGAYAFSPSGKDNIAIPYNISQIATNALTLEAWICPTALNGSYNLVTSKYCCYMLQLINGVPYFDIFTKQSTMERRVYSAPDPITLNQWHYLVGTFDGQTLKIYVDGTLMGTTTLSGKETIQNWENSIYIGDCGSPPQNAGLRGLIDNVAIFKRAKTQDEVTATYNQFKNKGIVADWAFDENNGDTYIDSSGNANDGVRQGDVSRIGHNDGQAVYFDGTGSDIELVRSPNLIPAGNENYTVEGWIKPDVMGAKGIIGWGNYGTANSVNAFRLTDNGLVNYWQGNDLTVVTGDLTGSWHHVAATFDGTTRKIFLDGFCVGKDAPTGHNAVLANLTIGKTSTSENFKGAIDNLVVYNRALSEDEILREYKGIEDNTVYPSFNYTYDKENQLIGVSGDVSASYTYDFAGNRVKKVEGNSTTYTFSPYYEMENGKKVKHYYAGDQLIADNNDGQLVFYHQDHLGSSVRLSDASGNEIKRMGFMPYGENSFISGAGLTPKYQYTGQEKDSTGLYYYGARFYDPELGRFLSLDPLGDDYCYANNNPIMFNDPSGMSSLLQDQYNIGDSDGGGGSGGYSTLPDSYFNSGSGYNVMPGLNEMMNTTTGAYYANAGAGTINYAGGVVRGAESGLAGSFNSAQNLWNGLDMNNNLNTLASVPFPVTEGLAIGLRGTIGVGSAIINNSRLSFIGLNEFKLARASVRLQLAKRFNIGRRVRQALKYPPNEIIEIFDPKYKNLSLEEMMKMPKLKITSRDFYLRDAIGHIEQTVHGAMIRRGQYKKIINDFFNGIKEILNNK